MSFLFFENLSSCTIVFLYNLSLKEAASVKNDKIDVNALALKNRFGL